MLVLYQQRPVTLFGFYFNIIKIWFRFDDDPGHRSYGVWSLAYTRSPRSVDPISNHSLANQIPQLPKCQQKHMATIKHKTTAHNTCCLPLTVSTQLLNKQHRQPQQPRSKHLPVGQGTLARVNCSRFESQVIIMSNNSRNSFSKLHCEIRNLKQKWINNHCNFVWQPTVLRCWLLDFWLVIKVW